jgi:SAM-dependent methyltransferase
MLPRILIDWLFRWRERSLRYLIDPLDRLHLRATGRGSWPPYSLRRHVGPPAKFALAARQTEEWIERFQLLGNNSRVLDIGCGCGAMVPAFARHFDSCSSYVGFDVHPPSIDYCRRVFAADSRFRFFLAEVGSPYGNHRGSSAAGYRFPLDDDSVDFVLAKSVFTHLQEDVALQYLREIGRVLRPGGRALVSAFLYTLPGEESGLFAALPHPAKPEARIRWRLAAKPEAAIAFEGSLFQQWVAESRLEAEQFVPIFWPGKSSILAGQDLLILVRAPSLS